MSRKKKRDDGFRSSLEAKVALLLPSVQYETDKIKYTVPASNHSYTPDFKIGENDYLEIKGRLMPQERKKHLLIQEQNPNIRIRFFFDKSNNFIYKGSKTTYADWCVANNFEYTDIKRGLPADWIK